MPASAAGQGSEPGAELTCQQSPLSGGGGGGGIGHEVALILHLDLQKAGRTS